MEELLTLYKAKERTVRENPYDTGYTTVDVDTSQPVIDDLTAIFNKLNGSVYTGKRFVARKSGDKMVQRLVYNRVDSLRTLINKAETVVSSGEEVTEDVMAGINLWESTQSYRRGGWVDRTTGVYKEGYTNYEWEITGLLSSFNTGVDDSSFSGIGWLGGDEDQYFTPHIYNLRGGRTSNNISFLTCLYVDIDGVTVDEAEQRLSKSDLPKPTLMVNSGGGVHYYWFFNRPAQANGSEYCFIKTWRRLATHFTKQLDGDLQCVDIARLLRIPGTINTKRGVKSEIVYFNDEVSYSIIDLHKQYNVTQASTLTFTQVKGKRVATKQAKGVDKQQPKPTLTPRRDYEQESDNSNGYNRQVKDDLLTLVELRNGDVEGHRHTILFYYKRFGATLTELESMNNIFIDPVPHNDIHAVSKSKGMVGKRPMRVTMMDRLNITNEESSHLMQLVPADVVSARQALRKLSDGYSKVFNAYSRYLNTLYSQGGKKTTKDKATFLGMTARNVRLLQKIEISQLSKVKEELVDSLIDLIETAVDIVAIIEKSLLDDDELQSYYEEIVSINEQLNVLNNVLSEDEERVGGKTRLRVVESKIKQLQVLSA